MALFIIYSFICHKARENFGKFTLTILVVAMSRDLFSFVTTGENRNFMKVNLEKSLKAQNAVYPQKNLFYNVIALQTLFVF